MIEVPQIHSAGGRRLEHLLSRAKRTRVVENKGRVVQLIGLVIESEGPLAAVGEVCRIESTRHDDVTLAEVVGFRNHHLLLMPLGVDSSSTTAGSDSLVGGPGNDFVVYRGNVNQCTVTIAAGEVTTIGALRVSPSAGDVAASVRRVVAKIDSQLPVFDVRPLEIYPKLSPTDSLERQIFEYV
jgi:hypothetical protein